jgi:small-conductance mechanosensitive channel
MNELRNNLNTFLDHAYLQKVIYHNTVLDYIIAVLLMLAGVTIIRFFKHTILRKLKNWTEKTANHYDDFIFRSIERFGIPWLYLVAIYLGIHYLTLPQKVDNILKIAFTAAFNFLVIRLLASIILALLEKFVRHQHNGDEKVKQLGGIMLIVNIFIWAIGLLFFFDNMGFNVTTIITGLGIGGIAIALAAQNILGDLFNYLVIFFDRPFETGDYIQVDQKSGTVEYIGIKTTRIQSLTGEQLVFANSDLTSSRIHNHKRMNQRRISFKFGVVYQIRPEELRAIPGIIKSIIEEQEKVLFDRAHFSSYGDSSLDFEVVYHLFDTDYNKYMDIQQEINFRMFEIFLERGIGFAYPTRTIIQETGQMPEEKEEKPVLELP